MRATGLPIVVRLDGRPVLLLGEGDAAEAKRRLLERAGARVVADDPDARLAIVAIDDDGAAHAAADALKARGLLVNVVDRPELCDFTLPAIVDRAPLLVAVATGGASAGLAAALRQRLETLLPTRLGQLAEALAAAREQMRARFPDPRARRMAIAEALGPGGRLDPLRDVAPGAVDAWLADAREAPTDRLERLVLASHDPDELTLRAARLLASADRIYHRPTVPPAILDRARADAARIMCDRPPPTPGAGLSVDLEMTR